MGIITYRVLLSVQRVKRTVEGSNPRFEDESPQPVLGNLSTHTRDKHPNEMTTAKTSDNKPDIPEDGQTPPPRGHTLGSARVMERFVHNGVLNPALVPTQAGFQRVFAAWILDDDLPFTQGESWSLGNLFKYLKVNFILPSNTTIRNALAKIFSDLHGVVVREFAVS